MNAPSTPSASDSPPTWLHEFQQQWTHRLVQPLDSTTGTLRSHHPAGAGAMNLQYWLRLLRALQTDYLATTCVLGAWEFNQRAMAWLQAHPPANPWLQHVAHGLGEGLLQHNPDPRLASAIAVDQAFLQITQARADAGVSASNSPVAVGEGQGVRPSGGFVSADGHHPAESEGQGVRPSGAPPAPALTLPLTLSPQVALVDDPWKFVELRTGPRPDIERPLAPPAAVPPSRPVVMVFHDHQISWRPLHPLEFRLLQTLNGRTLPDALQHLQSTLTAAETSTLLAHIQSWLEHSRRMNFWV